MPGPTGLSPRTLGRVAALVLALIFIGVVWLTASRRPPAPQQRPRTDFSDAPDISQVETGESIVLTLVDRENPGRLAGVIEADRLDPVGGGERLLTNPRAWLYPQDGRAVLVTADRARLLMPLNETPESGTLEGDVRVRVFTSDTPGVPPDDTSNPVLVAEFRDPVRFERRYMRLSTAGAFTVESDRLRFAGEEMTVMLNEVRRRLESLDVARGGRLEIAVGPTDRPDPTPASDGHAPQTPRPEAPAPAGPVDPVEPPAPRFDLYRTLLDDAVVATLGETRVESDRLELFTRLTDNALPDDAIARVAFARSTPREDQPRVVPPDPDRTLLPNPDTAPEVEGPLPPPTTTTNEPDPEPDAEPAPEPAPRAPADRLILTWTGPMSIRPIDADASDALAADDAAMILHADDGASVRITDEHAGVRGNAHTVAYYATRARLRMDPAPAPPDGPAEPVRLAMADTGEGRFAALEADLRTGRIDLPGPGRLRTKDAVLEWSDQALLALAVNEADELTDRLTHAEFAGAVDALADDGRVLAEALSVDFAEVDGRSALSAAVITRGSIEADAPDAANARALAADLIHADFRPAPGRADPARVEASGSVRARADGADLTADHAVADFEPDDAGRAALRAAHASGAVRYDAADDTHAAGDELAVDALNETLRLTGPEAFVAQGDSTVHGADINLDARARRMTVAGAGRFEHVLRDAEGLPAGRVLARWSESMRFDDAPGRLAALGEVSVVSTPDAFTRDTLSAHRVEVELTPAPTRDAIDAKPARRELEIARAYGHERPATVETRRYDPDDPERVTGLLYLEGDQVVADARAQTLRVPGAGTLLVMDRRPEDAAPEPRAPDADPAPLGPGLTRFTWRGAFDLDRAAGVAVMDDRVMVRHKTIGPPGNAAPQIAELQTDLLTATFSESDAAGNPFALRAADARGTVIFHASGRTLRADGARYEAASGVLHALALPGRLVELTEPGRPAPLGARSITWDLARDRIEINRPSPVTLPN